MRLSARKPGLTHSPSVACVALERSATFTLMLCLFVSVGFLCFYIIYIHVVSMSWFCDVWLVVCCVCCVSCIYFFLSCINLIKLGNGLSQDKSVPKDLPNVFALFQPIQLYPKHDILILREVWSLQHICDVICE